MYHSPPTLSSFLRRHTPSYPCSHRHTARGPCSRGCKSVVYGVCFGLYLIQLLSFHVSDHLFVLSRSSMDRGNTRSVSRAHLVPSRFYWSTRTHPVPPLLFCPSLLQMMSFKASRHRQQHLPHSSPLLPLRSIMTPLPPPHSP